MGNLAHPNTPTLENFKQVLCLAGTGYDLKVTLLYEHSIMCMIYTSKWQPARTNLNFSIKFSASCT